MLAEVGATAVVSALLLGAVVYAWRLNRDNQPDPKMLFLNTLIEWATRCHEQRT